MQIPRLVFWLLGAVCLVVVLLFIGLLRRRLAQAVPVRRLATLSLSDVAALFSENSRKSYLKAHPECQAVVLREVLADDVIEVRVCIYHTQKQRVEELLAHYHVQALSEDLKSVFGQKDMLVLR